MSFRRSLLGSWLALCLAIAVMLGGCAGEPDGAIRFDMEPIPGQPWTADGELVDADMFCPEGSRRWVGVFHPDGTPMTWEEFGSLMEAADPADGEPDFFKGGQEYTCADGSGSFTMLEGMDVAAGWQVKDGTGAYAGMTGEGTGAFECSSPPAGADDPYCEMSELIAVHLTGTVEMDRDRE